jgi:hypothetical protein
MEYFFIMYFKSNNNNKKYYFDMFLKQYFKKIKSDTTNLVEDWFKDEVDDEDIKIEKSIYNFESIHFNAFNNIK